MNPETITLLYVDDEPINLFIFEVNFKDTFNILKAETPDAALEILENEKVDVVISDMKMPGMDGLEFIDVAKAKYSNINYYLLTGFEQTPSISDAIENGLILSYFQKPMNVEKIKDMIHTNLYGKAS